MASTLPALVQSYIEYLQRSGHKRRIVNITRQQLDYFVTWCQTQSITASDQISDTTAADYVGHLQNEVDLINGAAIGIRIVRERVTKLRRLFEWLARDTNFSSDIAATVPTIDKRGKANLPSNSCYDQKLPA
ncbi:site-specific tyrosine recombinase XerC [Stieleria neptunia]|uniref:Site-specific tyrosine recombinase XerC n=1 Tax=Stieleria neptunia TaxID=2527979 RepID=A0A518HW40_9BACT|nr:hypothetical protein [Stieleria neptunia]QDV45062.1 site-specific tyrosine recombinase XerC [Stieleria neptunia]